MSDYENLFGRYIFLFDDASRGEALRVLGRFASNPELSMTWYDAAVLSQKVRDEAPAPVEDVRPVSRFDLPAATDNFGLDDAA